MNERKVKMLRREFLHSFIIILLSQMSSIFNLHKCIPKMYTINRMKNACIQTLAASVVSTVNLSEEEFIRSHPAATLLD